MTPFATISEGQENGEQTILIPSGAGAITNVLWMNNTRYLIDVGTNTVQSTYPSPTTPILIQNKSNIVIEGFGPQSVIYMAQTGSIFKIEGSYNIQFRNFKVVGTRQPNGHDFRGQGQFAAFWVNSSGGHNGFLLWDGVHMIDHGNFAIGSLSEPRNSTNCIIRHCYFENIGSSNLVMGQLDKDGADIVVLGSDMVMHDNTHVRSRICFEPEGFVGALGYMRNIVFTRNTCKELYGFGFNGYSGTFPDQWTDWTITDNTFEYDRAGMNAVDAIAIRVTHGRRGIIANNTIKGARAGIFIINAADNSTVEDWVVENNVISGSGIAELNFGSHGILLSGETGTNKLTRRIQVRNNVIRQTADDAIRMHKVKECVIEGNQIISSSTNRGDLPAIYVRAACESNFVRGNLIWSDGIGPQRPNYSIWIDALSELYNVVENNVLRDFTTAPWFDGGLGTEFWNNWSGANLKIWDGSDNGYWNWGRNWTDHLPPTDGDDLIFPGGATRLAVTNDFTAGIFRSILFQGSNYTVHGNAVTLSNAPVGVSAQHPVGTNHINVNLTLVGPQVLDVLHAPAMLELNGSVSAASVSGAPGGGSNDVLKKAGAGTCTLTGTNTYTGSTTIQNGTLRVDGLQPASAITVDELGTLAGSGVVGSARVRGRIAPAGGPGVLTISNLVFEGGTYLVELNGRQPGRGYDQISTRGTNFLASARLELSVAPDLAPLPNEYFTIIDSNGADPIWGSFVGLPQGAILTASGMEFQIDYTCQNDVTLTFVNPTLVYGANQIVEGNGNGLIDPNECNLFYVTLRNQTATPVSGVSATLVPLTAGVSVTQPVAEYSTIPGNAVLSSATPFQVSLMPGFVCGTTAEFMLVVQTATNGSVSLPFIHASGTECSDGGGPCEVCPERRILGSISENDPRTATRIPLGARLPSLCERPQACPGSVVSGLHYDAYTLVNGESNSCITVSLSSECSLFSATYLNFYNPSDACQNYVADAGYAAGRTTGKSDYSFIAQANSRFVIIVGRDSLAEFCPYILDVTGGSCRPVLNIAQEFTNRISLDWTTAAAGYRLEMTNSLDNPVPAWVSSRPILPEPTISNSRYTLSNIPAFGPANFYRLRKSRD